MIVVFEKSHDVIEHLKEKNSKKSKTYIYVNELINNIEFGDTTTCVYQLYLIMEILTTHRLHNICLWRN